MKITCNSYWLTNYRYHYELQKNATFATVDRVRSGIILYVCFARIRCYIGFWTGVKHA